MVQSCHWHLVPFSSNKHSNIGVDILNVNAKPAFTHSPDQLFVFFWLAEEPANVADADGAIHAAADPVLVLISLWQPVPEDPESFPNRLLTN